MDEGTEILRVLAGSHAYNLDTPESDYDYHGVFVIPTSRFLVLGEKPRETSFVLGDEDNTSWELRHFLEMAINGNPTVLETFVAPVEYANAFGYDLLALFPYVLSRKRIYDGYRGYAKNQRTKMFEPPAGTGDPDVRSRKAAVAYLRSLYHGFDLLNEGTYRTEIPPSHLRDFLIKVKNGSTKTHQVIEYATRLDDQIKLAYERSEVRLEPDMDRINAFLLRVRREMWV